jgi:hypothetical protein
VLTGATGRSPRHHAVDPEVYLSVIEEWSDTGPDFCEIRILLTHPGLNSGDGPVRERGQEVSTHVHRNGAHKITVEDDDGRQVVLLSQDRTLQVSTTGPGPRLTPQMAHDLAEELHQWADCMQTVRRGEPRSTPRDR